MNKVVRLYDQERNCHRRIRVIKEKEKECPETGERYPEHLYVKFVGDGLILNFHYEGGRLLFDVTRWAQRKDRNQHGGPIYDLCDEVLEMPVDLAISILRQHQDNEAVQTRKKAKATRTKPKREKERG